MKTAEILILVLLVCSCHTDNQRDSRFDTRLVVNEANLLIGHWAHDYVNEFDGLTSQLTLSFSDSLCLFLAPYGDHGPWLRHDDTLLLSSSFTGPVRYQIKKLTSERLVLMGLDVQAISNNPIRVLHQEDPVLTFRRLPQRNNLIPTRITFSSSVCFGSCPSLLVQIDSDGAITYEGGAYAVHSAGGKGQLGVSDFQDLVSIVQTIDTKTIKDNYSSQWTDGPSYKLRIDHSEGFLEIAMYTRHETPLELDILISKLLNIHQLTRLDSIDTEEKFYHSKFLKDITYNEFIQ